MKMYGYVCVWIKIQCIYIIYIYIYIYIYILFFLQNIVFKMFLCISESLEIYLKAK